MQSTIKPMAKTNIEAKFKDASTEKSDKIIEDNESSNINKEPRLIDLINDQKRTGSVLDNKVQYIDKHKPIIPSKI